MVRAVERHGGALVTLRAFIASALREGARRVDTIEHPDPRGAASLVKTAANVRSIADVLDPRVHRCVVCDEMLSTAMTETHACPDGALVAWHARQLDAVDGELDS